VVEVSGEVDVSIAPWVAFGDRDDVPTRHLKSAWLLVGVHQQLERTITDAGDLRGRERVARVDP
jgi:hypothetical protein